jgi:hypothetical protein
MRIRIVCLLVFVSLIAGPVHADVIQYDHISANAVSYVHFDVSRFLTSQLCRQIQDPKGMVDELNRMFGGPLESITLYCASQHGKSSAVLLIRVPTQKLRERIAAQGDANDTVVFTYDNQEVHYSRLRMMQAFVLQAYDQSVSAGPTTRKSDEATARPTRPGNTFTLGFDSANPDIDMNGPSYLAFVGQDLVVCAADLRAIADAIDVLHGKSPSLAKEDPKGLKLEARPGVIVSGTGLSAQWTGGNVDPFDSHNSDNAGSARKIVSTTRPVKIADAGSGGFGLDLFGSFKGKAKLARIDMGEDEHEVYVDAFVAMVDVDSAEQLKNLIFGVKALISLSQASQKPLIDPLTIQTDKNKVILHWSWPTARLSELIRLARQIDDHGDHDDDSLPTKKPAPASQPSH